MEGDDGIVVAGVDGADGGGEVCGVGEVRVVDDGGGDGVAFVGLEDVFEVCGEDGALGVFVVAVACGSGVAGVAYIYGDAVGHWDLRVTIYEVRIESWRAGFGVIFCVLRGGIV